MQSKKTKKNIINAQKISYHPLVGVVAHVKKGQGKVQKAEKKNWPGKKFLRMECYVHQNFL